MSTLVSGIAGAPTSFSACRRAATSPITSSFQLAGRDLRRKALARAGDDFRPMPAGSPMVMARWGIMQKRPFRRVSARRSGLKKVGVAESAGFRQDRQAAPAPADECGKGYARQEFMLHAQRPRTQGLKQGTQRFSAAGEKRARPWQLRKAFAKALSDQAMRDIARRVAGGRRSRKLCRYRQAQTGSAAASRIRAISPESARCERHPPGPAPRGDWCRSGRATGAWVAAPGAMTGPALLAPSLRRARLCRPRVSRREAALPVPRSDRDRHLSRHRTG